MQKMPAFFDDKKEQLLEVFLTCTAMLYWIFGFALLQRRIEEKMETKTVAVFSAKEGRESLKFLCLERQMNNLGEEFA